jgi:hypothetical protein
MQISGIFIVFCSRNSVSYCTSWTFSDEVHLFSKGKVGGIKFSRQISFVNELLEKHYAGGGKK